jgi:hypothetical protein
MRKGDMNTSKEKAVQLINAILSEILLSNGKAAFEKFDSLRDVDHKVEEFRLILSTLPSETSQLVQSLDTDDGLTMNSRRIRLETLARHCRMALRFLSSGVVTEEEKIVNAPTISNLTASTPNLEKIIQERWVEAQKCQYTGAYLAAVILMGSILEGLLLSRTHLSAPDAHRSSKAPKRRDGSNLPLPEWNLNSLIEVAVDLKWLKVDRGKFSHALRESRNVVHPWQHALISANFDEATCKTCWSVLNASIDDLITSI